MSKGEERRRQQEEEQEVEDEDIDGILVKNCPDLLRIILFDSRGS